MTPIEMADAMEGRARVRRKITNREDTGDRLSDQLEQAATMLRQQQAEIEALKAENKFFKDLMGDVEILRGDEMNNEPVAWMQTWGTSLGTTKYTVNIFQIGKNDIPLYTQDQLEDARKLGMQQERALWNLSTSTQEIMDTHPAKELTDEEIHQAIRRGFARDGFLSDGIFLEIKELLRKTQNK